MDIISLAPYQHLVKAAITGPPGTPNWSVILQILSQIEANPNTILDYITVIIQYLNNGKQIMNCLILIDALFKNSKKQQLTLLQLQCLLNAFNRPHIAENPQYHNFIFKSSPAWIAQCTQQGCLNNEFNKWQQEYCSFRYVPRMSGNLREKFFTELDSSLEICGMFAQTLVTTFSEGGNYQNELLLEILPNVREILRRIGELEPLVVDSHLLHVICSVRDFAELCIKCYHQFSQNKPFDTSNLLSQFSKYNEFIKKIISKQINQNL